ncbi:MAG TPA: M20/M25/M40 family metallo-hydrolase [Thermoanaerobaculia bacterium]|nr:M20/M25/M40 family metallo-hydrolase [Thermoanaerobaculia bacterium]
MRTIKNSLALLAFAATAARAADSPDLMIQTRIRQEGLRNSKVMEIAGGLTDGIGARLTGSPNMKRANEWTRDKLTEFGLSNAHLESWGPFGRGWSYESCSVRMVTPDIVQLEALPKAWSPATSGVVRGKPVKVKLENSADLEKAKGKLAGRIVMLGDPAAARAHNEPELRRYDTKELEDLAQYDITTRSRFTPEESARRRRFRGELAKFLADEKALVAIEDGRDDFGTMIVQQSGSPKPDEPQGIPTITISSEHYGRIARLLDAGKDVEVEVDVHTTFYDQDPNAYNTIAEIPGSDRKGEVVMLGAHLDSWHAGTGATDNGAGVAATMEAVRILKAIGVVPKRTIRIALWSGEEQGLLGSRAYVTQHFGKRAEPKDPKQRDLPSFLRTEKTAIEAKPEHAKLSAYFNFDNGTGRIRGIYAQSNAAVVPIFESWIAPLHDLGVTTVTMRNTGSTDHVPFDAVDLPGFQFIQDEVEYETRTHHTNEDTYERLQKEDLMQAATVLATFVWEAANRPEMMPRKPLSQPELPVSATAATPH